MPKMWYLADERQTLVLQLPGANPLHGTQLFPKMGASRVESCLDLLDQHTASCPWHLLRWAFGLER